MAAVLRAGPGARVTGPAVLGLFDVDGFTPRAPFELVVPDQRRRSRTDFGMRVDPLPGVDEAVFDEIPIKRLPTALLDAAAWVDRGVAPRRLRVALDSALRKRLTRRGDLLDRAVELAPGHPGARWLLDLEAGGGLTADSEREREVTGLLQHVHPRPEVQAWLTDRIRPDYLWRPLRLVGEYLGWVDHHPDDVADDDRFRRIRRLDHDIVTITARDLRDPDALIARVQTRLVLRARELGVPLSGDRTGRM